MSELERGCRVRVVAGSTPHTQFKGIEGVMIDHALDRSLIEEDRGAGGNWEPISGRVWAYFDKRVMSHRSWQFAPNDLEPVLDEGPSPDEIEAAIRSIEEAGS